MRNLFIAAIGLTAAAAVVSTAQAGCVGGAVVGGVAGHLAGHHGGVGAVAGCAVGHHMAKKKQAQHAARSAPSATGH